MAYTMAQIIEIGRKNGLVADSTTDQQATEKLKNKDTYAKLRKEFLQDGIDIGKQPSDEQDAIAVTKPKVTLQGMVAKEVDPVKRDAYLQTMMAQDQKIWNERSKKGEDGKLLNPDAAGSASFRDYVHNKYNPTEKWNPVVGMARNIGEKFRNFVSTGTTDESIVPEGSQTYDWLNHALGGEKTVQGNRLSEYEDLTSGKRTAGVGSERDKQGVGGFARDVATGLVNPDDALQNIAGIATGIGAGAIAGGVSRAASPLAQLATRLGTSAAVNAATTGGAEYVGTDDLGRAAYAGGAGAVMGLPFDAAAEVVASKVAAKAAAEKLAAEEARKLELSTDFAKSKGVASAAHPIGSPERTKLMDSPMQPDFVLKWSETDSKGAKVANREAVRKKVTQAAQDPAVQEMLSGRLTPEQMQDPDMVLAALNAEHLARNPQTMTFDEVKAAQDMIPSVEKQDAWFGTGTPKQQETKLKTALRAYGRLRANGHPVDPRFEGKNEIDLLTEHITKAKDAGDDATASILQGEAERLNNRAAGAELVKMGAANETAHGAAGEAARVFVNDLTPLQQRHLLADYGTGDAATDEAVQAIGSSFGASVDQLRSLAKNQSVTDKQFAAQLKKTAEHAKVSYENTLTNQQAALEELNSAPQGGDQIQSPIPGVDAKVVASSDPSAVNPDPAVKSPTPGMKVKGKKTEAASERTSLIEGAYAESSIEDRSGIIEEEILSNPAAAEQLGLTEKVKISAVDNKKAAGKARSDIRKVAEEIAAGNESLPELFR